MNLIVVVVMTGLTLGNGYPTPTIPNACVTIFDQTAPQVELVGPTEVTLEIGEHWQEPDPPVTVTDFCQTTVSRSGGWNEAAVGSYVVTYTVTDACGNETTVKRAVEVVPYIDRVPPVIFLK